MDEWIISWEQAIRKVDPYEVLKRVLISHRSDIIELNQEQLGKGIKSTGERLSPYSAPYAKWRKKRGLQTANKDEKVTGDLWNKMYAIPTRMNTLIGSRDFKEKYAEYFEGDEIWSLTPDSIDKLLWERGVADDFVDLFVKTWKAA